MAITYLQALNRTLVRLRESEVTNVTGNDSYTQLIAQFLNEAHEEVEDAYDWNYQNATKSITIVSGTSTYALTGWGTDPAIELVYDSTRSYYLTGPVTNAVMDELTNTQTSTAQSASHWSPYGVDSSGDLQLKFFPEPTNGTIKVLGRVKTGWLTDQSDMIMAPHLPVVDLAYAKAVSERGEDGGISYEECMAQYHRNLARSVAQDAARGHKNNNWSL